MYRPFLVTPPSILPVTLAEFKEWTDMPAAATDKDGPLTLALSAAVGHVDGWTGILGRALCEQTWRQDFDGLSLRCMRLPLFPVISITSVKYKDTSGAEQTIDAANYTLQTDDLGSYVQFLSTYTSPSLWTELPRASVTYKAGYANTGTVEAPLAGNVPPPIKQGIVLLARHWFDNPTAVVVGVAAQAMPKGADALLSPYERKRF